MVWNPEVGLELPLDTPLSTRVPSLPRIQPGCQPPHLLLTFHEDLDRLTRPLLPLCIFTVPLFLADSFIFLMYKVETVIKPSSEEDCEN